MAKNIRVHIPPFQLIRSRPRGYLCSRSMAHRSPASRRHVMRPRPIRAGISVYASVSYENNFSRRIYVDGLTTFRHVSSRYTNINPVRSRRFILYIFTNVKIGSEKFPRKLRKNYRFDKRVKYILSV